MARRGRAAAVAEPEEEEGSGGRSQRWKHEAQLEWMTEEFGYDYDQMTPLDIVTAFALYRVPWRRSDRYAEVCEEHREAVVERRAERRAARQAEREAAKGNGAAKPTGKTRAAAKKTGARKTAAAKKTAGRRSATRATRGGKGGDPFA